MKALEQFEDLIENTIEASLSAGNTAHLQPVEIAKKLTRALDSAQTIGIDGTLAPNAFLVLVSQRDYDALAAYKRSLERELAAYLRAAGAERGLRFVDPPTVHISPEPGIRPRRMRVQATLTDAAAAVSAPATELTAQLPVDEVRAALQQTASLVLGDGRSVILNRPVTSLGRQLDNDVVLEDKRVSRHHAHVRYEHRNYCLYDLASANGTFVNGERVEQVILRDGDRISLGGHETTFQRSLREDKHGA